MKAFVVLCALTTLAIAEPPVPNSQYLPSNKYGPPSNQYGPPSNQYGVPGQTEAIVKPNNQYIPPSGQYGPPSSQYGPPGYGKNGNGYDDQSEPANYQFEYHVKDDESGNDFGHEEARQGDVAQGKYYVLLPDGRRQTVEYVADNDGYKPKISYEQVNNGIGGGGGGYRNGGYSNGGYQNGGYPKGGNGGYQY